LSVLLHGAPTEWLLPRLSVSPFSGLQLMVSPQCAGHVILPQLSAPQLLALPQITLLQIV
jgi:hypothetical protein